MKKWPFQIMLKKFTLFATHISRVILYKKIF